MTMVKAVVGSLSAPGLLPRFVPLAFTNKSLGFASSQALASRPLQTKVSPPCTSRTAAPFMSPMAMLIPASAASTVAVAAAPIAVGDKLPDATFAYLDNEGQVQTVSVADLTKGKKAVLFAVPGAFTPTCSQKHLPGFVQKSDELHAKGVDTIACISVNDVFVMRAWGDNIGVGDKVLLLSDGNLAFTNAIGVTLDLSDKPVGLGIRSRRYSLLAEDGVVKVLHLEEGGSFTSSGAEDILKAL